MLVSPPGLSLNPTCLCEIFTFSLCYVCFLTGVSELTSVHVCARWWTCIPTRISCTLCCIGWATGDSGQYSGRKMDGRVPQYRFTVEKCKFSYSFHISILPSVFQTVILVSVAWSLTQEHRGRGWTAFCTGCHNHPLMSILILMSIIWGNTLKMHVQQMLLLEDAGKLGELHVFRSPNYIKEVTSDCQQSTRKQTDKGLKAGCGLQSSAKSWMRRSSKPSTLLKMDPSLILHV